MSRPDEQFISEMRALEAAYLESDDPIVQSGFHGGRNRWVAERLPLVEAIDRDGDFLDVGCANGLLVSDVVLWASERGYKIVPFGIDLGAQLIAHARQRLPEHASNFTVADAWTWHPVRHWTFVYSLMDLAPEDLRCEWIRRLFGWVKTGGRLIIGSYGSRSRKLPPEDVSEILRGCGLEVTGQSAGGRGPVTHFAWVVRKSSSLE